MGTETSADLGLGGSESTQVVSETTTQTTTTANEIISPTTETVTDTTAQVGSSVGAGTGQVSGSAPSSEKEEIASKTEGEKSKEHPSILERIGNKLSGKTILSGNDQKPALSNIKSSISAGNCTEKGGENGNAGINCTENKSR